MYISLKMDTKQQDKIFVDFVCRESVRDVLERMNYIPPTRIFTCISKSNLAKDQRILKKIRKIMQHSSEHLQQTYDWCLQQVDKDNNRTNPVLHLGLEVLCQHGLLTWDLLDVSYLYTFPVPVVEKIFSNMSKDNDIYDYLLQHPEILSTDRLIHLSYCLDLDEDRCCELFAKYRSWNNMQRYSGLYPM